MLFDKGLILCGIFRVHLICGLVAVQNLKRGEYKLASFVSPIPRSQLSIPTLSAPCMVYHIPSTSVLWSLGCSPTSKRRQWRQPHWMAVVVFLCKFFTAHALPAPLLEWQLGYALLNRIMKPLLTHQTTYTQTGREISALFIYQRFLLRIAANIYHEGFNFSTPWNSLWSHAYPPLLS